jgi:hypothetical protein
MTTYESKQGTVCDCGHDGTFHKLSVRGKYVCVYRDPKTDDPCYCDGYTISMKPTKRAKRAESLTQSM